jgi:hypothetical protein
MQHISTEHDRVTQQIATQRQAAHERKRRMQGEEARYTLVLHSARKQLDISINEYCLADTIHKLSGARSQVPGWCYASKEQIGNGLGFSRQSIHSMINKLKKKGLIEVQVPTGYLRSTDLWNDTVEILKTKVFGS